MPGRKSSDIGGGQVLVRCGGPPPGIIMEDSADGSGGENDFLTVRAGDPRREFFSLYSLKLD